MNTAILLLTTASVIASIGLLMVSNTNNVPSAFAQGVQLDKNVLSSNTTTSFNATSSLFKRGVFVTPMLCTTPNDVLNATSKNFGSSNATANAMMMEMAKNQMMTMIGGRNMTQEQLQQAVNTVVCFPAPTLETRNTTGLGR
jgi:hypothetical protein